MAEKVKKKQKPRLTRKEAAFVASVLSAENKTVTDAVLAAGYEAKDRKIAGSMGSQLLSNPKIQSALESVVNGIEFDAEIKKAWSDIFSLDPSDPQASLMNPKDVHDVKLKAIQQLSKIKGLEAPKRTEKRVLTADFTKLIPTRND